MIKIHDNKDHQKVIAENGKDTDKCVNVNPIICNKCENYVFNPFNTMMECKILNDSLAYFRVQLKEDPKE